DRREARTSLIALLRVNRFIAKATLPFIYHNPFLSEHPYTTYKEQGLRKLVRTLLGDVLHCGGEVPKNLIAEFQLDSSRYTDTDVKSIRTITRPLNYLGHLRYLDLNIHRFTTSILRERDQLLEDEVDYVEGEKFWSQCPISNNSMVLDTNNTNNTNNNMESDDLKERMDQRRKELAWHFWGVGLYRDMLWTLAMPLLDQLEGLSFPLSDISRWTGVVAWLERLESLEFVLDEIPPGGPFNNPINNSEASKLYKDEAMKALVHFVSEHTWLFKGQLKNVNVCFQQHSSRYFDEYWYHDFQMQIYRLLPPMNRPTFLSQKSWKRLLAHPEMTDLGYVREVSSRFGGWGRTSKDVGLEEYPRFLQRCRVLRQITSTPLGRGSFRWAVEEKKYLLGEGGERGGGVVSSLVPLERVEIHDYDSSTDEADDIAYAFSSTLKALYIYTTIRFQGNLPQSIEIGSGWVDMPVLTDLRINSYRYRLLIDQMLLFHCPNLTTVQLSDNTWRYQCQDIKPTLSARLAKVTELELQGWPALTFHPETLSWATELKVLRICSDSEMAGRTLFIPPVEELNRSYGDHQDADGVVTEVGVGQRPAWSWDWKFRQLWKLEFTGEFAFRFQFRMLCGCPSLKELVLKMKTRQESSHVRVLTHADFSIPDDETVLENLDTVDRTTAPAQDSMRRIIIAHSVTTLTMSGGWVLSDSLIATLLHESFPQLREISLLGCSGFTLPALIACLRRTKARRISRVVVSISEPKQKEREELGIVQRIGRRQEIEVLKVGVFFVPDSSDSEKEYVLLKVVENAKE
ncbi:hypothetical protein BGZ91_012319, partial [Linnemannia elongata]